MTSSARNQVRGVLAAILLMVSPVAARAQEPGPRVAIEGQVREPVSFSIEGLAALASVEVQAPREGGGTASYVGPLLWPILATAGLVDGPGPGAHLQHVLYARGADGYMVAVAIGEIDPQFEGKPVIVAYKRDGVLLARPRLVVPGDHRPGRAVRDLVAIDIR